MESKISLCMIGGNAGTSRVEPIAIECDRDGFRVAFLSLDRCKAGAVTPMTRSQAAIEDATATATTGGPFHIYI
jgi:hypothetical protein